MFGLLFAISAVCTAVQLFKEVGSRPVPVENWANKELYYKDVMNGVPVEQRMKNLESGKYKMANVYPEPNRNPRNGKIVIENSKLYYEDAMKYGAYQAQQWVRQGRYNLNGEELKRENERIKSEYKYLYNL